jgi:hypothetical protein
MIKQTWNISDDERNRILNLHESATKRQYLVIEQNEVKTESETIPLNLNWARGKWKLTPTQINSLTNELVRLTNFIRQHQGSEITIQIRAGESQVTNYDREQSGNVKLESGVLSEKRGTEIVNFLNGYFKNLVDQGKLTEMPIIPNPMTVIGHTPYSGTTDLKDTNKVNSYNSEQFIQAIISLKKDYDCIVGMEVTIGYFPEKGQSGHGCDEAIFELKLNGVSLGIANLNNSKLDYGLNAIQNRENKKNSDYKKTLERLEKQWSQYVASGDVKDNPKQKEKFFQENSVNPEPESLPEWVETTAKQKGYADVNQFMNDLNSINDSFEKYGRKKYTLGGSRSQTFTINGETAKKIVDNTQSDKLVLSIKPLVGPDGPYKIFYQTGTHSDTPWVIIQSRKSKDPLYNGTPNVDMKRGDMTEKVILERDLCGNPLPK